MRYDYVLLGVLQHCEQIEPFNFSKQCSASSPGEPIFSSDA